jgi:hypothetical protein
VQLTISNSIFWGNSDPTGNSESAQLSPPVEGTAVDFSTIEGWTGTYDGVGTLGLDPLFIDSDGLDNLPGSADDILQLAAGSPCIDSGSNLLVSADEFDLDDDGYLLEPVPFDILGQNRIEDDCGADDSGEGTPPITDMGAHEHETQFLDCNLNETADACDILNGDSLDQNGNTIPDECEFVPCEADTNGDGTIDPLDGGYVLARLGCFVGAGDAECDAADANLDGVVDPMDFAFVLARLGPCP